MTGIRSGDDREPAMAGGWDSAADLWKDPAEIPDPASVEVPGELRAQIESGRPLHSNGRHDDVVATPQEQGVRMYEAS